ncbi:hypothetical protein GPECTOR_20g482 [Gonium pectorale]|uniref:Sugar phosphate transporter domain-containing protein n=1 Tax=Gonium pectorale TaxID=33097 RepID=A0A150GIU4_GONPE|nr:hypothetical protein GPECTOR_20g482 [Gonium pectorale]|eukprot:KXZ49625.1 hypothetical protein GPECTOR_20g482 [Gonium pectorale]
MVGLHWPYPCTIAWLGLATTTVASFLAMHALALLAALTGPARASRGAGAPVGGGGTGPSSVVSPPPTPAASRSRRQLNFAGAAAGGGAGGGFSALAAAAPPPLPARLRLWPPSLLPSGPAAARAGFAGISARHYVARVLPTGFFMALTFTTGNMGYLHLTVAFVQMLKAFCPVVTMLLLFATRLESPSGRLGAAVGAIAAGVALASYGELNLSLVGLSAMLVSVVAESVRLVMTQHLLAAGGGAQLHPLEGLFYISSACMAVLAAQAAATEWPRLAAAGADGGGNGWGALAAHPGAFASAAGCGFAVNLLAIAVIKLASSLTLKVLGTVKDAALVSIGILFLHERVTRLQLVGYAISMAGFLAYNVIKAQQGQQGQGQQGGQGSLGAGGGGEGGGGGGVGGVGKGGGPLLLPLYASSPGSSKER